MAFLYSSVAFVEIAVFFAAVIGLLTIIVRAIIRSVTAPKLPPPKKEDLRHFEARRTVGILLRRWYLRFNCQTAQSSSFRGARS